MVRHSHDPAWPDKAVFAAGTLTFAGVLGTVYALLRVAGASMGTENIPVLFAEWPDWIMLPMSIATLALGGLGVRFHSALFTYLGALTGIASLALVGLVPLLAVIAVGFMVKAHFEGEDTTLRTPVPDAETWPDKAFTASLLLYLMALVTLFQALLTYADRFDAILFEGTPGVWATWQLVVGLFGLFAAREVYRLRRAWTGSLAAVLGILGLALYLAGPLLSILVLVLLGMADREQEFAGAAVDDAKAASSGAG